MTNFELLQEYFKNTPKEKVLKDWEDTAYIDRTEKVRSLEEKAEIYASFMHNRVNHDYDGSSYIVHLRMVYIYAIQFQELLPEHLRRIAKAAAWTHDIIEDCRETYNDVLGNVGWDVAEITYALTNNKGKTRAERADDSYYEGIRNTPGASYVKVCDRLANTQYSKAKGSTMFTKYKAEYPKFKEMLYSTELQPMFVELEKMYDLC